MHLLTPLNLLWLPPIMGVIVLMYILKLRRKDVVVSSTFLWRQVIRDVQANAPFQKLRKNLLLFLQLLIAALLVFALMHPFVRSYGQSGRNIVLVVDTGVSMRATDVSPTRLDAAKRQAHDLVNSLRAHDRMMLIAASSRPEAGKTGFTDERAELHRAIDSLQPHDTPTSMREALNLAADLVASRNNGDSGQIDLISDGAFAGENAGGEGAALAGLNLGRTHLVYHPIGSGHDNVGIVAVDFRRNLGGEKTVQLLVVTHNYATLSHKFVEEIYDGETLKDAHEVELAPGGESTEPYDIEEPPVPHRMRIHLDLKDDLSADNDAALILKPRKTIRALLVGADNVFLENALKVDPSVELDRAESYPGVQSTKDYDVVLFYNSAPAKLPPSNNYFFIHCVSDQCPARVTGTQQNVAPADWERNDPVLRYVDLTNERFVEALQASPLDWGREIAVADSGSLVVAGEKEKMRALFVSFDPVQSPHFPLAVAFPIFVSNAVRWLGAGGDDSEIGGIHTGAPITIPAPPGSGPLTVTRPDGVTHQITVGDRGGAVYDGADQIGVYTVKGANVNTQFAANLANVTASDIAPHRSLSLLSGPTAASGRRVPDDDHGLVLRLVILLALAVLVGEWYAFHRRVFAS